MYVFWVSVCPYVSEGQRTLVKRRQNVRRLGGEHSRGESGRKVQELWVRSMIYES